MIFRPGARYTRVLREGQALILEVPMPWLAGPCEEILAHGTPVHEEDGFLITQEGDLVAGVALAPPGLDLREAARSLYARLLNRLGGQSLYRIWNYVPQINQDVHGQENYRAFNAGRHDAFLTGYGPDFAQRLPAASALGIQGDRLALCFLAGPAPARHFENPEQVPAFQYPAEYGPTPPSFARGTVVRHSCGQSWFLSGTASIKGHASLGNGFAGQARLTFDNVRLMFERMDLPQGTAGTWKIFLRNRQDLAAAQAAFAEAFPEAGEAMFLEADICRSSLLLEVEATFQQPISQDPTPGNSPACKVLSL